MQIHYLILIWRVISGVQFKCIEMISVTNSSISRDCWSDFCVIVIYCRICGVTEVMNRKSVYRRALLGAGNAEGPNDTVELNVEWNG